ncbi:MAG: nucleotidyltransferase domain-containing protein [Gemmatimonadota bacterium]|nr:nucleotidyltransferase domain-containing protein [Gemmatimonadota bacterium]
MPVTSLSSSVKRWPTTETVIDGLRRWCAHQNERRTDIVALGYFGSYARGDEAFGSDLDLVAVVESSSTPYLERARTWPTHTLAVPTDLIVYTADEWQTLLDGRGRFAEVLSNETVWLIGPPD